MTYKIMGWSSSDCKLPSKEEESEERGPPQQWSQRSPGQEVVQVNVHRLQVTVPSSDWGMEGEGRKYSGPGQSFPRSVWVGEDTGSVAQLGKDSSRTMLSLIC